MADNVTNLTDTENDNDETRLPTRDELFALKREAGAIDGKMAELRGDKGALLKEAANTKNVHKKAFKQIVAIMNMDESKREDFLVHFDLYRELFGIDEGRTAQLPLEDKDAAAA